MSEEIECLTTKVLIEPIRTSRGYRYRVKFGERVLVENSRVPTYDACRALLALGVTGRLEVWRPGAAHPAMLVPDIAKAAGYTVAENETAGPKLSRWKERSAEAPRGADATLPAAGNDVAGRVVATNTNGRP